MSTMTAAQAIGLGLTAAGTGASIAGGIEGKNARQSQEALLRSLAGQQQQQSSALLELGAPLRLGVAGTLSDLLAGGSPENLRVFAPARESLESQFTTARNAIINTVPARGGQLNRMLADLEVSRARGVSGLDADLRTRGFDLASQIGFGTVPTALSGSAQAGTLFNTIANAASARETGSSQALGQIAGIGTIMALKAQQQ